MKTSILIGHHDHSFAHSTNELPAHSEQKHNTLQQIVTVAAFSILLVATTFVISNGATAEVFGTTGFPRGAHPSFPEPDPMGGNDGVACGCEPIATALRSAIDAVTVC